MQVYKLKKRRDFMLIQQEGFTYSTSNKIFIIKILPSKALLERSSGMTNISESTTKQLNKLNSDQAFIRFGLTASKKIGKAHDRNFAKRRIRNLVRAVFSKKLDKHLDLVFIATDRTLKHPFAEMIEESEFLCKKINQRKIAESYHPKKVTDKL